MTRKGRAQVVGDPSDKPCRLIVCRGCCCGTKKKVPGTDHKEQLKRLSGLEDHEGRSVPVRVSTCLGICFKANVVVVQPSSKGRAGGGRPVWLGEFAEDRLVDELDDWIFEGGPGAAPLPDTLRPHLTSKDAKKPKKKKLKKQLKEKRKQAEGGGTSKDGKPKDAKRKDGKTEAETKSEDTAAGEAKGAKKGKKKGKKKKK